VYLVAALACSLAAGRQEFGRGWLALPALCGAAVSPLCFEGPFPAAWAVQWAVAGLLVSGFLNGVSWRRRLLGAGSVWGAGALCWGAQQGTWCGGQRELLCLWFVGVCALALLALRVQNREQCLTMLRNLRWERVLHYLGMWAFGVYLSASPSLNLPIVLAAAVAVCLAWAGAVASNDVVDLEIDRVSNPGRPLVTGTWSPRSFGLLSLAQGALALLGGFCVGTVFAVCLLAFLAVTVVYSAPPLRLKRYLVVSSSLIALGSVILLAAGFVSSGARALPQLPAAVPAFLFIALACGANFKDIKDYEGDRREGIQTVVTLLGLRWGKVAAAALVSAGFLAAPLLLQRPDLWLPALVFAALVSGFILRPTYREKPVFFLYYGYVLILIARGVFREQFP
jgi:4-hydroxybenzoate polyprenyltransferase